LSRTPDKYPFVRDLEGLTRESAKLPGIADIVWIQKECQRIARFTNEYLGLTSKRVSHSVTDGVSS